MNMKWLTKMRVKRAMEDVNKILDELVEQNIELLKRVDSDEKEHKVKEAEQKTKDIQRRCIHLLDEKESEEKKNFIASHKTICQMKNHFRYIVSPSPLGNKIEIQCLDCGFDEDITNYDDW
jgi:predicted nuclease with TOPRIM domain